MRKSWIRSKKNSTIVAAAIVVRLAEKGYQVHLTTTDPILKMRAAAEKPLLERVEKKEAKKLYSIPFIVEIWCSVLGYAAHTSKFLNGEGHEQSSNRWILDPSTTQQMIEHVECSNLR